MKRTIALLTLLGLVGTASASTIAYWRFEEGTAGVRNAGSWDEFYQDSSGNGNHLSAWPIEPAPGVNPTATATVPYATVPQTGSANNLALDFSPNQDIATFGAQTSPKMIETYMFNHWTVEATFKLDALNWQVLVGKEGKRGDLGGAVGPEAPFWLKLLDFNKHLEVLAIDDNDNFHAVGTLNPILADEWYSVAARFDGTAIDLWLKGPGDTEYVFQAASDFFGPDVGGVGCSLGGFNNPWTVGRGSWDGNPADFIDGVIDEVKISDTALAPSEFIAVPEPGTLGLFALTGGGMLWVRKRFKS